jgi:very-short-patch-repair endonuclease
VGAADARLRSVDGPARVGHSVAVGPFVRTELGTYWADFLWERHRLIGECDGAMKYGDPQAIVKEKRREQVLRDRDFGFVRWEATESVLRPDRMLGRIERALGQ